jgi:hypothetical protein
MNTEKADVAHDDVFMHSGHADTLMPSQQFDVTQGYILMKSTLSYVDHFDELLCNANRVTWLVMTC